MNLHVNTNSINTRKISNYFKATLMIPFLVLTACKEDPTFSILEETDKKVSIFNNKVDILWVIDNSGSMANLQTNVANNFSAFVSQLVDKGYDFQMAVTTTEAWNANKENVYANCKIDATATKYKDDSGIAIITPDTPNIEAAFIDNIKQGTSGCGDERAFDSMMMALNDSDNQALGFPRANTFLAVIIVSDEDDFSHDGGTYLENNYNHPDIHPVSLYVNALDNFTGTSGATRRYNVSAISINDDACLAANDPWGLIGIRMGALVDATNGVKGNVCASNFSDNLIEIQEQIISLSTQQYLSRVPHEDTIKVYVNGVEVAESDVNGWQYNSESNSIMFFGDAKPEQGALIDIVFDPVELKK